jgi:osmotically-inducible protein OsmY
VKHRASVCLGAALAVLSACKSEHAPTSSASTSTDTPVAAKPPPLPAAIPDAQVESAIDELLTRDPVLKAQPIHVTVSGGAVTLTGTVRTLAQKWRAARLASGLRGATSVVNGLLVSPRQRTDAELAKAVNDLVKTDPATSNSDVRAAMSGGTATLSGIADSYAQRELMAEDASRIRGVQAVTLAVTTSNVARSDAEIATDAADELRDDARLDGTRVKVVVRGQKALLSGVVGSLAQRDTAVEDAWNTGVVGVDAQGVHVDWRENEQERTTTRRPPPSDGDVATAVRRRLSADVRIDGPQPDVRVDHGVVTLTGIVPDFRAERAAVRDAHRARGVAQVDDRLTVPPALHQNDATIENQIMSGIYDDGAAPDAHDVQVLTNDGRVTLQGSVASEEEKKAIEDDVEEVPGVAALENDLKVRGYGPQTVVVAPEAIQRRVTDDIFWDPRVPVGRVTVKVGATGEVTLSGLVESRDEGQAAEEDAVRAGAAHVLDYIRVDESPASAP